MSRAIRVETRSRLKDDMKRAMHSVGRVRKWEKKWVRIGDTSMQIFKWMPLKADDQQHNPADELQQDINNTINDETKTLDNNNISQPGQQLNDGSSCTTTETTSTTHKRKANEETTTDVAMSVDSPLDSKYDTAASHIATNYAHRLTPTSMQSSECGDESANLDRLPSPPAKRMRGPDLIIPELATNEAMDHEDDHQHQHLHHQERPQFNELRRVSMTSSEELDCIARSVTDQIVSQVSLDIN